MIFDEIYPFGCTVYLPSNDSVRTAGTNTVIRALVYQGIPSDLRSRPEQSPTFLGLCSPDDYSQSIESSMGVPTFNCKEEVHKFTMNDYILRLRKKVWFFIKSIPLAAKFIYLATSAECAGPIILPTAVKGLIFSTVYLNMLLVM